jgi:hypothetical protein
MSAITLDQANTQLSEALVALSKARKYASMEVEGGEGRRKIQRQTLDLAQADVTRWELKVKELENEARAAMCGGSSRVARMRSAW